MQITLLAVLTPDGDDAEGGCHHDSNDEGTCHRNGVDGCHCVTVHGHRRLGLTAAAARVDQTGVGLFVVFMSANNLPIINGSKPLTLPPFLLIVASKVVAETQLELE